VQRQEIRSLADLAGEGTRILTALVRDTHSGIAERVFGSIGPASKPVEVVTTRLPRPPTMPSTTAAGFAARRR